MVGRSRPIAVVGAGLAGLSAAYLLKRAGRQVIVYEARSRPGGRVLTLRDPFADGLYAEAGAGRIADVHRSTLYWVNYFGLELESMYPAAGQLLVEDRQRRIRGADAVWLSSNDVHRILRGTLPLDIALTDRHPTLTVLRNALIKPHWYRIKGGMDQLPRAFADELGDNVQYNAVVTALERDAGGVRIIYEDANGEGSRSCDFAVCAIPYTTLRAIRMSPALPEDIQHVLRECKYESAIRVFLQLRDRSCLGLWNGYGVTWDGLEIWQPTVAAKSPRGLLVLYGQGDPARGFGALTPEERIARAIDRLDEVYPGVRDACEAAAEFCWDEEPWSFGAQHTGVLPGDVVRRAAGRVHFAGAHTSSEGWMDGALESGYRVVREILGATEATIQPSSALRSRSSGKAGRE